MINETAGDAATTQAVLDWVAVAWIFSAGVVTGFGIGALYGWRRCWKYFKRPLNQTVRDIVRGK